ncbi:MAG: DNA polymerase IV [Verrucomicrobiae bacterium]|nr:DNA polymerase IV [Verrucomicrobiae bacterium]
MKDSSRWILHMDMDAFFAAVEQRDHLEYAGKPLIVGAPPDQRGIVSTCSYEARRFGVHSAMPSRTAGKLCPNGIFVPPDMDKYREESRLIMNILSDFSPAIEPLSIDEAFLDVTQVRSLLGEPLEIARRIKQRIREERRLTASIGVAPNKFLAKLASDLEKPDGLVVITEENKIAILAPLPASRLWGVGQVTQKNLAANGLKTIGDIQNASLHYLRAVLGNGADFLHKLAWGIDERELELSWAAKSVGSEHTFPKDTLDLSLVKQILLSQAGEVAGELRRKNVAARTVSLKLRYADFTTLTRQTTLAQPTQDEVTLYDQVLTLLSRENLRERKIRLIGLSASNLTQPNFQLDLFDQASNKRQQAAKAVDAIRSKLGHQSIQRLPD